ncbi:MAG: hypothetical protein HZB91_09405 [Elusimicrobia bacterium]|nr:hypothetical protein [Elusimicrobiota bacterium]
MRPRKTRNLDMLAVVAKGLAGLKEKVVFVGGATIDLYLSDPTAAEARATDDVDCVVELARRSQYYGLEEELRGLGFKHSTDKDAPVCRWEFHGIQVDVMPTEGGILGFKNRWYADGVAEAGTARLPDGQDVAVLTVPYLVASKIEAFLDRGKDDFLASPDMEDIVAVIDGCPELKGEVLRAPAELRSYLAERFKSFLAGRRFVEAVHGHIRITEKGVDRVGRALAVISEIAAAAA